MARSGIVGVIPARGGSKGLPGKNIRPLASKPLVAHTIEAARGARLIDRIILTTDSEEIASVGKQYGAEVPFIRPSELATDTAHTPPVLEHAVRYLEEHEGYEVSIIVTLQPTSPLRRPEHIDQAVEKLLSNDQLDSVISIKSVTFPPFWMMRIDGERLLPFVGDGTDYSLKERQEMPFLYQPNGAVYVTRRGLLRDKGVLFSLYQGGNTGYILMDEDSSIDIDGLVDFVIADNLIQKKLRLTQQEEDT